MELNGEKNRCLGVESRHTKQMNVVMKELVSTHYKRERGGSCQKAITYSRSFLQNAF